VPDAEPPDAGAPDAEVPTLPPCGRRRADAEADARLRTPGPARVTAVWATGRDGGRRSKPRGRRQRQRPACHLHRKNSTHPLGPRIGKLLGSIYQWRDFFGPAGIDPIRDVDRVMVTGSQLRNSKDVVAILKLNVGQERIRGAIDAIVRADAEHGEWLDASVPAATAYADRAPRIFVLGSPGTVIVTPPSALENVIKSAKRLTLRPATGPRWRWRTS
jgi:hypothetical protein